MVKITNQKVGEVCIKMGKYPIGLIHAVHSESNKVFHIKMVSGDVSCTLAPNKAELTELIEMLQQFAEYLEE